MALCGEVGKEVVAVYLSLGEGSLSTLNESPQGIVLEENQYFRKSLSVKIKELELNLT